MFKLDNPDAVQSLSMMGGKTWHLQPGTLEVHGSVLRFNASRANLLV
jgi:hypothetical protein